MGIELKDNNKLVHTIIIVNAFFDFLGFALTIFFIVAKLSNWVNWSWWWILVPTVLPNVYKYGMRMNSGVCKNESEEID